MNIRNVLLILTIVLLPLEGTVISLPVIFALGCLAFIIYPGFSTVFILFFAGLLLDILRVQTIGVTSASLILSFILIYFYARVFEFKDWRPGFLMIFLFTFIFAKIAGYSTNLIVYFLILAVAGVLFSYFGKKQLQIW